MASMIQVYCQTHAAWFTKLLAEDISLELKYQVVIHLRQNLQFLKFSISLQMLNSPLTPSPPLSFYSHYERKIEQLIISQQGSDTLILADLELQSLQTISIVAALIPQHHSGINHIILSGNKISGEGFQIIFSALLHCTHLQSIMAECNNLSDCPEGLEALLHLNKCLHNVQLIDLQNNDLNPQSAKVIAEILRLNKPKLKVCDLRWNEIGESGAQYLRKALPENQYVQFIGLEDNRISTGTLLQIEAILKGERQVKKPNQQFIHHQTISIPAPESPHVTESPRTQKLRSRIQCEQQLAQTTTLILEQSFAGLIDKIRQKAPRIQELQANHALLLDNNAKMVSQLRQEQIALCTFQEQSALLSKQLDQELNYRKSLKVKANDQIRQLHEKIGVRHSDTLNSLSQEMENKMQSLTSMLKCKLQSKQRNREILSELKEQIMKMKVSMEDLFNKSPMIHSAYSHRQIFESSIAVVEERIAEAKAELASQTRKAENIIKSNRNLTTTCFQKEQLFLRQINQTQLRIKSFHFNMTNLNLQTQSHLCQASLLDSKSIAYSVAIDSLRDYSQYLDMQSSLCAEVERKRQIELSKQGLIKADNLDKRIQEIQGALRVQNAQNKLIKQKYEQMRGACENLVKTSIYESVYEEKQV